MLALGGILAQADSEYPNRPVRLIAAAAPGGNPDVLARLLSQKLSGAFGKAFVVENVPGAGGVVAAKMVAATPPDGHVLMLGDSGAMAINVVLNPDLGYDPLRDFTPITALVTVPTVLVVHPSVPARTLQEFIALAKSKPGQLAYGSAGPGSIHHLTMAIFAAQTGIDLLHVPYRGGTALVGGLVKGEVQAGWSGVPNVLPLIEDGRLRVLCISTQQRSKSVADVPTAIELGIDGVRLCHHDGSADVGRRVARSRRPPAGGGGQGVARAGHGGSHGRAGHGFAGERNRATTSSSCRTISIAIERRSGLSSCRSIERRMPDLRIYGVARTRAFRALWIAKELGLDYEHIPIEIGPAGARKAEYLAINPNGRLPAIDDGGFVLWESLAITLYLAKKHGRLYPATLEGEAKAWQWSLWSVQEVDRGVNIWSLHAVRLPPEDRDPQRLAEALKVLEPPFKVLEGALAERPYLLGDEFTVADLNVAAVISRAIDMDLSAMPRIGDWLKRCLERPAARAARALRAEADAQVPVEVTRAIARHNRL